MKAKTINQVITKKVKQWLESINDAAVRSKVEKNIIVTGGCITSMLLKEPVNDFDIYFKTREAAVTIAEHYIKEFGQADTMKIDEEVTDRVRIVTLTGHRGATAGTAIQDPSEIDEAHDEAEEAALNTTDDKYRPVFITTNAITLTNKIQLVLRFFGEPDEIHENYDFVHCTNYWESGEGKLTLRKEALECILAKELRYQGSKYPLCSIIRLRKFIKRGWTINVGQILKMVMQLNDLDLTDYKILEEQLTGVDVMYFIDLIYKVKEKDPEKVNSAYMLEMIDRMF